LDVLHPKPLNMKWCVFPCGSRYLYWGQRGHTPGIYRAGLDGSSHHRLVHTDIEHPTAMTMGKS
jgi:hypothetical protein